MMSAPSRIASATAHDAWFKDLRFASASPEIGHSSASYNHFIGTGSVDSPLVYSVMSTPFLARPPASSAINSSVPPYFFGGTEINGGATIAILMVLDIKVLAIRMRVPSHVF